MFCYNCGKEVNNGAKFCPYCGARLNEEPFPNTLVSEKAEKELAAVETVAAEATTAAEETAQAVTEAIEDVTAEAAEAAEETIQPFTEVTETAERISEAAEEATESVKKAAAKAAEAVSDAAPYSYTPAYSSEMPDKAYTTPTYTASANTPTADQPGYPQDAQQSYSYGQRPDNAQQTYSFGQQPEVGQQSYSFGQQASYGQQPANGQQSFAYQAPAYTGAAAGAALPEKKKKNNSALYVILAVAIVIIGAVVAIIAIGGKGGGRNGQLIGAWTNSANYIDGVMEDAEEDTFIVFEKEGVVTLTVLGQEYRGIWSRAEKMDDDTTYYELSFPDDGISPYCFYVEDSGGDAIALYFSDSFIMYFAQ